VHFLYYIDKDRGESEGVVTLAGFALLKPVVVAMWVVLASSNSPSASETESFHVSSEWILEEAAGIGNPWFAWTPSWFNRTSIAIDSKDMPHIAYQNLETLAINYSYKDETGKWQTETVVEAEVGGASPALALTTNDAPVICYHNLTLRGLSCAFSENSGWKHATVDAPIVPLGNDFSLALDAWNRPHLAYYEVGDDTRYAWWNGTSWNITVLRDGEDSVTVSISMDLDLSNRPHIALGSLGGSERGLWYYRLKGTKWDKEVIDSSRAGGIFSIDLNDTGSPHLAMRDPFRRVPLYVYKDASSWRFRYVDLGARAGFGSFSLDSNGKPHVVYTDRNQYDLRYAHVDNGSWKNETVDSDGRVGFLPSIAMDKNNIPHISYIDLTDKLLMYATKKKKVEARIDIDPDTLNLKSRGKWLTCYIELSGGHDPRDVKASTILLNNILRPELDPRYGFVKSEESYIVDHNGNGVLERMVKFDRQKVIEILSPGVTVTLTVAGQLSDGTPFEGSDTIRIIERFWPIQTRFADTFWQEDYVGLRILHFRGNVEVKS